MRCKQCYKDYLEVSVDDVERAGFTERYPKRKSGATYYVRDTCEYALARTKNGIFVILDKETYESVKDISIYTNNKGRNYKFVEGLLVYIEDNEHIPRIRLDGKDKMLHRVVMGEPKGVQIDHINHNQSCCIKENLRPCNNKQNTINRQDRCGVWEYGDEEEIYYYAYDLVMDGCIKKRCDSKVDCFLGYRDTARVIYKGTELEKFVYDIENDFSETLGLLIHYYILGDITKKEMYQMNLDFWEDKFNKKSIAIAV